MITVHFLNVICYINIHILYSNLGIRFACNAVVIIISKFCFSFKITNGNSKLSQEIARQMINNHQCKVILVFEPNVQLPDNKNDCKTISSERIYRCNFLDHNQVKQLKNEILQNDGTIDILIENGKMSTSSSDVPLSIFQSFSPEQFIEETSNKIIITLNVSVFLTVSIFNILCSGMIKHFFFFFLILQLLIHFIPALRHSTRRGHFVTIQSEENGARPFLETSPEIKELIRSLNVDGDNVKPRMPNELCLSTVVYNKSDTKLFKQLELNLCEIAGTIIRGIQSEKQVVVVSERRSLINYFLKLIKFKCS